MFKKLKFECFIEIFESIFKKLIAIISKSGVKYSNSEDFAHYIQIPESLQYLNNKKFSVNKTNSIIIPKHISKIGTRT